MRSLKILFNALLFGAISTAIGAPVNFPGTNTGAIPDNSPVGRSVAFAVSGLAGPISSVALSTDFTHTYIGDLTATLIAPNGVAALVVFGRVGGSRINSTGDSSNLSGTYVFSDLGRVDLLPAALALDTNGTLPNANFRTTSPGAPLKSDLGVCATSLRGAFGGLTPAQANGTWQLIVKDSANGDIGSISTSILTLDAPLSNSIFANGFENTVAANNVDGFAFNTALAPEVRAPLGASGPAHCINKVQADFTGDGRTDFALARANGAAVDWLIRENLGGGIAGDVSSFSLGLAATDQIDSADLDGDRIADPLVWRPGAAGVAAYTFRLSSRGGAVRAVVLGQTGDVATQSGDYDGDGIDDLAYFRAPSGAAGPTTLNFLRSSDGTLGSIQTGVGTSGSIFSVAGFDYSGDGLADIALQQADSVTPANARFRVLNTSGTEFANFLFGLANDFIHPGNYVGSPRADVTVVRTVAGSRELRTRDVETGLDAPLVTFGITGDGRPGGDYDGDGLSDHGVFRTSATVGASTFQIRISSGAATLPPTIWTLNFGQQNDFAVAGSRVQ